MDFSCSFKPKVSAQLIALCRRQRIEIINCHSSKDASLCLPAKIMGIPLVRSRHVTCPIKKKTSYQYLCSHVIATAAAIKQCLVTSGVSAHRISVVGEGVDLTQYRPDLDSAYLRSEFDIAPDDTVIVNIGMIRSDKGQEYYLQAAKQVVARYPNSKFFLLGEATNNHALAEKLRRQVADFGLSKHFFMTGYRSDVAEFMHLSDFVVIASTGVEAQSRVAPQAFATRRPVIATDVGGLTELVHHRQNGLIVAPKDADALAEAMIQLIEQPQLRDQLAENGYQFAQSALGFEHMMEQTLAVYRKLLHQD
jgi:glycosyltransferase involved in cell wall biosynthesis